MCRFFSNFRWIKPSWREKKRKVARDLYEKKRIYIWSIRLLCVLSQCQRDNQRDFQSEIPTLTFHFEIVFSSLYKFCEGMFRRETVHSHFLCLPHLFVFRSPCRAALLRRKSVFVATFLRRRPCGRADAHTLPKTSGLRSGMWWVGAWMGCPGCLGRRRGGRWWGHNAMCMHGSRWEFASRAKINAETLRCLVTNH